MKRMLIVTTILLLVFTISACDCNHQWEDANCTKPNTCSLCGKTKGTPLNHIWKEATCNTARTCRLCGETQGEPPGHTSEEWVLSKPYYAKGTGLFTQICKNCGIETESVEKPLESLHNEDEFLLSPDEFYERFKQEYAIVSRDAEIHCSKNEGQFACAVMMGGKQLGVLFFANEDTPVSEEQKQDATFTRIYGSTTIDITDAMSALVKSCDPTLDYISANALALEIIRDKEKTVNGIVYKCNAFDGGGTIEIELE